MQNYKRKLKNQYFFIESEDFKALRTIMDVAKPLKLPKNSLSFESHWNCKYTQLQVFELSLLFLLFMVKNAFHYSGSSHAMVMSCKKDVFYRFLENRSFDWRKIVYRINLQLSLDVYLGSCLTQRHKFAGLQFMT